MGRRKHARARSSMTSRPSNRSKNWCSVWHEGNTLCRTSCRTCHIDQRRMSSHRRRERELASHTPSLSPTHLGSTSSSYAVVGWRCPQTRTTGTREARPTSCAWTEAACPARVCCLPILHPASPTVPRTRASVPTHLPATASSSLNSLLFL